MEPVYYGPLTPAAAAAAAAAEAAEAVEAAAAPVEPVYYGPLTPAEAEAAEAAQSAAATAQVITFVTEELGYVAEPEPRPLFPPVSTYPAAWWWELPHNRALARAFSTWRALTAWAVQHRKACLRLKYVNRVPELAFLHFEDYCEILGGDPDCSVLDGATASDFVHLRAFFAGTLTVAEL